MSTTATSQNLVPFTPGHEFGNGGKREYPLTEAVALQKLCMNLARNPKVKASDLSALARAWDVLEERKRILRGIPLPGQFRPDQLPGKRASKASRQRLIDLLPNPSAAGFADDAAEPVPSPAKDKAKPADAKPRETDREHQGVG